MTNETLNQMVEQVGKANQKWWIDLHTGEPKNRNIGEMCMLVISEIAEAMEGHRKDLMDDKIPHRTMFEVELVDVIIRLMDMASHLIHPRQLRVIRWRSEFGNNVANSLYQLTSRVVDIVKNSRDEFTYSLAIGMTLDLMDQQGLDFEGAFKDKMEYNATRYDHTVEGRLAEGGKKY